jgi:hypothetical protein
MLEDGFRLSKTLVLFPRQEARPGWSEQSERSGRVWPVPLHAEQMQIQERRKDLQLLAFGRR